MLEMISKNEYSAQLIKFNAGICKKHKKTT